MFTVCPQCDAILDCFEPIGNFDTRRVLCGLCAEEFARDIYRMTVQDAFELGKRLKGK